MQTRTLAFATHSIRVWRTSQSSHQALSCKHALSLSISVEDNTQFEDDLPLFTIDKTHNLGDTPICVIEITKNDVVVIDNDKNAVWFDTPTTESKFLMEQA